MPKPKFSKNHPEFHTQDTTKTDPAGHRIATAQDFAAQQLAQQTSLRDRLWPLIGSRWTYKGNDDDLLNSISGVAAVKVNELQRDTLVRVAPFPGLPLVVEIANVFPALTTKDYLEWEQGTFDIKCLQVVTEAIGDEDEIIHNLGSKMISVEQFSQHFECDNVTITRAVRAFAAEETQKRKEFEAKIAKLPPKVSIQQQAHAGMAAALAKALVDLGIAPQGSRP